MKGEKVKLTLWLPKDLVVSGKVFKLNFSQLLAKSLQKFFINQEIDPNQLFLDIFNEKQDRRDERREFYRKRAEEFWQKVYTQRALYKQARYEAIRQKIELKEQQPFGVWDGEDMPYEEDDDFTIFNKIKRGFDDEDFEESDSEEGSW